MIRKPDAREFRESTTVSTLRDARTLAVEGGRGVGQGAVSLMKWWFVGIMGFGVVMSVAAHMGPFSLVLALGGGLAWFLSSRGKKAQEVMLSARIGAVRTTHAGDAAIAGTYELSVGAAARRAAKFGVPAILLFPTSNLLSFMAPFTTFGIVLLALAFLIVARVFGDRTTIRYDARALTVKGLLGEATMLWEDVTDVRLAKAPLYAVPTLFNSGSRRNIVVSAASNRLGGSKRLLIAYPLLDLDQDRLVELVSILISLQSHAPVTMLDALPQNRDAPRITPARVAEDIAAMPFDGDAIMAAYMASRKQVVAEAQPDASNPAGRVVFGRKVVPR